MALAIVQGVILVPLYLHYLGSESYGWWLAISSIIAFAGLADLGLTSIVTQRIAVVIANKNHQEFGELLGSLILLQFAISILIAGIAIPVILYLPSWIGVNHGLINTYQVALFISLIDLVLTLLVGTTGSILFGAQRPLAHMLGSLIGAIVGIILTIILMQGGMGLLAIPLGALARSVTTLPFNCIALSGVIKANLLNTNIVINRDHTVLMVKSSLWLAPAKFCETVVSQIDSVIVLKLMSPHDVTTMSITRKAIDIAIQGTCRISTSLLSGIAHLRGCGEHTKTEKVIRRLIVVSITTTCALLIPIIILNEEFIRLWTKPELYGGQTTVLLFAIYALSKIIRTACGNAIIAAGDTRSYSQAILLEATCQVIIGVLLCPLMGVNGIAIASILGSLFGLLRLVPRMATIYNIFASDFKMLIRPLFYAIIVSYTLGTLLRECFYTFNWASLFITAIATTTTFMLLAVTMSRVIREAFTTSKTL